MTDSERDLTPTFSALREAVRHQAAAPPAAAIRGRAERRVRVRRTTTALLAAVAVAAVTVGGVNALRDRALQTPVPPSGTVTPTPGPSSTPTPTPRPSKPVPPWPTTAANDPIAKVKWGKAKLKLPPHKGCPSGAVQLRSAGPEGNAPVFGPVPYPRVMFDSRRMAYGDLTGDGHLEAVVEAICLGDAEGSGDGEGQLLVVTRHGGELVALGWVGPRGAIYAGYWVDGGELRVDVHPWHTDWGYRLGTIQAYRWDGSSFRSVDRSAEFPGVTGGRAGPGPAVDLAPVADRSGCPAAAPRFDADGKAVTAGTGWLLIQPTQPDSLQHVVALDLKGPRRLLVAVLCGIGDTPETTFLAVLDRAPGGGFRAVDALRPPEGRTLSGWEYRAGVLMLESIDAQGTTEGVSYTWNGEYFQR